MILAPELVARQTDWSINSQVFDSLNVDGPVSTEIEYSWKGGWF